MFDEKQISEWAEHECDTHHGGPCIGKIQWHAERRELAQALVNTQQELKTTRFMLDGALTQAMKAEAARDALAAVLVNLCHPLNQTEDWPPFSRKLQDAEDVLDQHAPDWRQE